MKERIVVVPGDKKGRLTVRLVEKTAKGIYLHCDCDCGGSAKVYKGNFTSGASKSCGCYAREVASYTKKTHGKTGTCEYMAWRNMLNRCYNKKTDRYSSYGARGISVCDSWRASFESFYADVGPKPSPSHSIGRIDNNGNYEPENCRWETSCQQINNTTRTKRVIVDGEEMLVVDAAKMFGVNYTAMLQRVSAGISGDLLKSKNLNNRVISIGGVSKLTTEWMRYANIPISSFYYLLRKGMSREEIVNKYISRM